MIDGSKILVDRKAHLGRGATATIYKANNNGDVCAAKIYNQDTAVNKAKINAMLSNVPANITIEMDGKKYPRLAWPTKLLESNGTPTGYLMPLVDLNESFPLDYYYDQVLFKKLKSPDEAALSYKLEIAKNLSLIVAELHSLGHYFIDLKPQNIRVFRGTHIVTLLDCDGFSIKSYADKRYPAELISTDYISPEAYRENTLPQDLGENQDRYALAVIIFQLLNQGTHPFQGILKDISGAATNDEKAASGLYPHGLVADARIAPRKQSTHTLWLDSTRTLFDQAFVGSRSTRPSASEWARHFDQLLFDKALVRCAKASNNVAHMRFKGKKCSACYLSALTKNIVMPSQLTLSQKYTKILHGNNTPKQRSSSPSNNDNEYLTWIIAAVVIAILFGVLSGNKEEKPPYTPADSAPAAEVTSPNDAASISEIPPPAEPISDPAPHGYGSIYYSQSIDQHPNFISSWALGYTTQSDADQNAKKSCERKGGEACKVWLAGPMTCLAIASGDSYFSYATANTLQSAEDNAVLDCGIHSTGCQVLYEDSACSP